MEFSRNLISPSSPSHIELDLKVIMVSMNLHLLSPVFVLIVTATFTSSMYKNDKLHLPWFVASILRWFFNFLFYYCFLLNLNNSTYDFSFAGPMDVYSPFIYHPLYCKFTLLLRPKLRWVEPPLKLIPQLLPKFVKKMLTFLCWRWIYDYAGHPI